jgi:hypothetical protein
MSAIVLTAAVEKGVPYRTVPEMTVMLGDGRVRSQQSFSSLRLKLTGVPRPRRNQNQF